MDRNIEFRLEVHMLDNTIRADSKLRALSGKGITGIIDTLDVHSASGFNEGQERLLGDYERGYDKSIYKLMNVDPVIIPPLWMLAHAYLESENARRFFDENLVMTSSARAVDLDDKVVSIAHCVRGDKTYSRYLYDKEGNYKTGDYGCIVQIPLEKYPKEDIELKRWITEYNPAAKALFLMDDRQLERLSSLIPDIPYQEEKSAMQGACFADSIMREEAPFLFGTRKQEPYTFFGVTVIEYFGFCSYGSRIILGEDKKV